MIDSLVCPYSGLWNWRRNRALKLTEIQVKRFNHIAKVLKLSIFLFFPRFNRISLIGWIQTKSRQCGSRFHDRNFRLKLVQATSFNVYLLRPHSNKNENKTKTRPIPIFFPGNYDFNATDLYVAISEIAIYSNNCNWFNQAIDLSIVDCNQWFHATINRRNCTQEYHLSRSICIQAHMHNAQIRCYIVAQRARNQYISIIGDEMANQMSQTNTAKVGWIRSCVTSHCQRWGKWYSFHKIIWHQKTH